VRVSAIAALVAIIQHVRCVVVPVAAAAVPTALAEEGTPVRRV
jgi:hypothetical protein